MKNLTVSDLATLQVELKTVTPTSAAQLDLIPPTGKGRGGARIGAGRKPGEKSQVVRVPVGCLNLVMEIIERHKAGDVCLVVTDGEPEPIPAEDVEHFHLERARSNQDEITATVRKYVDPKKRELLDMGVLWLDPDGVPLMLESKGKHVPVKYALKCYREGGHYFSYWSGRGRMPPEIDDLVRYNWKERGSSRASTLSTIESGMVSWGFVRVADL